jgi:hypothetical protein
MDARLGVAALSPSVDGWSMALSLTRTFVLLVLVVAA